MMHKLIDLNKIRQIVYIDKNIVYNIQEKELLKNNQVVKLSSTETKILELLIENKNQIVTKDNLFENIFNFETSENNIRTVVYRLRKKLDTKNIETIKDQGYIFKG
jgi:DNA-binding response OmpR family regulator